METTKSLKISVSAMDGLLVGRREQIHSGVLNGEYVVSCALSHLKEVLVVIEQDSH